MPQPDKAPSTPGGTRKAPESPATVPSQPDADGAQDGVRDSLARLLNPFDTVLLTRDRLQEVLDDAVRRGRMTRTDAADLITEILSRSRRTTEDLIADVDQLLGGPADRLRREVERARRVTGLGSMFPITGYESLSAAQVQARLADLSPAELRRVRDYERRNANRKTVLAAIETRLG